MFNPSAPAGSWFRPTGATSADPRGITAADQASSGGGGTSSPQEWDALVAEIQAALAASSGFARWQKEQELNDAKKGRQNAYKIAQLNAETSRYGVDANRETQLAQLKQQQAQFEKTHALSLAEAYTKYASTPDMRWAAADFDSAVQRTGAGMGVAPISTNPNQPVAKTWADFAALTGFQGNPSVQASQTTAPAGSGDPTRSVQPGGGTGAGRTTDANGDGVPDQRIKAVNAVVQAIPPSGEAGNTEQDWAALNAVRALYFAGKPGSVEALGASRRKTAQAGMARLGYDVTQVEEDYQRGLPGQTSVRRA